MEKMAAAGPDPTHTIDDACGNRYNLASRLTWAPSATVPNNYLGSREKAPAEAGAFPFVHTLSRGRILEIHAAHATHAATRHRRVRVLFLGELRDHRLGGDEQAGHGSGVL